MNKPISKTALRRAARYLKLDRHDTGCNEVATLRALIEQAEQAQQAKAFAPDRRKLAMGVAQQLGDKGVDDQEVANWLVSSKDFGARIFNAMAERIEALNAEQAISNKCFLVSRGVENQGEIILKAFVSASAALAFEAELTAYEATKPQWPEPNATEREWGAFNEARAAWLKAHPGGEEAGGADYYDVAPVPLVPAPAEALTLTPGLYAVRHLDNWDGQGDICVSLATYDEKGDGIWRHDESGREVLEYQGDKILQAWHLFDSTAPALTYAAGLAAASKRARELVAEYVEEHGTWTDDGKALSAEHKEVIYQLRQFAESIAELASTDPVPCSHEPNQPAESDQEPQQ